MLDPFEFVTNSADLLQVAVRVGDEERPPERRAFGRTQFEGNDIPHLSAWHRCRQLTYSLHNPTRELYAFMQLTFARNDLMGWFTDDAKNLRGLWFCDVESVRNEWRLRACIGMLEAKEGFKTDLDDYAAVVSGKGRIKEMPPSAGGGYAIMFPSSEDAQRPAQQEPQKTLNGERIDFGIFVFNSADDGITGNYATHSKRATRQRIAEQSSMVLDDGWRVLSGDLFGTKNMGVLIRAGELNSDATLLDPVLRQKFLNGESAGFTPYVIGVFMCPNDSMRHADARMKQDRIAGYLGLVTFKLPSQDVLQEIGNGLTLPMNEFC